MPLIACPECAREISDQANACPHCGHPLRVAKLPAAQPKGEGCFLQTMNLGCAIVFILIAIVVIGGIMAGGK